MSEGDVRDYRSLGEILRDAREKKGWSVEELHDRTRIAPRMLQALESDDFDQFDSPVYARGFVRQLAGVLDLDPDWLLTKLGLPERPPQPIEPDEAATQEFTPVTPPTAPPVSERGPVWEVESVRVRRIAPESSGGGRARWITLAVATAVIVGAVVVWTLLPVADGLGPDAERPETRVAESPAPRTSVPPAETPGEQAPVGEVEDAAEGPPEGGDVAIPPEPADDDPVTEETPPVDRLEWHPSTAPAPVDERTAERSTAGTEDADIDETADQTVEDEGERAPARADMTSTPARRDEVVESTEPNGGLPSVVRGQPEADVPVMRLVITARERVEVDVELARGQRERRVLEAGEVWRLTGTDHFLIRASDPDAADFELDGIVREPPPRWTGAEWFLRSEPADPE